MNPRLKSLLGKCDRNEGASPEAINNVLREYPLLPEDYLAALRHSNGVEGWIGEHAYLMLYSIEELAGVNEAACADEFAPGMFIFGSDGGGMSYAFDLRTEPVKTLEVPSEVLSWDEVWMAWDSFMELLEALAGRA